MKHDEHGEPSPAAARELWLGLDTGGTYTDAVLLLAGGGVLCSAKALTTREDLSIGLGGAIRAILAKLPAPYSREDVRLVSVSTTLATNAVVERRFVTAPVHQGYIEPHACVAAWNSDGQAQIWASSQGHFMIRELTAAILKIPQANIRVTPLEIGGGFGGKETRLGCTIG